MVVRVVVDCGQPLLVGGDSGLAAGLVDLHPQRPIGRRLLHAGQPDRSRPGRLASATTKSEIFEVGKTILSCLP